MMSLLAQCPRCGNAYVRRSDDTATTITCRRCLFEFRAAPAPPMLGPTLPCFEPIVISSVPADFVIELQADDVHEVEHIEVLDVPSETPAVKAAESVAPGSLELEELPALKPLVDDEPSNTCAIPPALPFAAPTNSLTAHVFTELEPPAPQPPPVRDLGRRIDIRKRSPSRQSSLPAGVWIGLGIGILALFLLVLVIIIVAGSGPDLPAPDAARQQQFHGK